ncbi:hypothetical protein [Actinomyces oris]|uniref:hypothetical protein n=1 Tax=Actinomyces oris TaxID=544580 RepID=UPI000A801488|nr:hypothetical protein [Actinomyces oris]
MTVIVGILALIGLAVVGAIGWAFAHGVRDGLAAWREAPPVGTSQPVPVGEPPLSLSAALPSSYQAGQLAGEVAASWHSAHQAARTAGAPGIPASSSWAAALALGSELSQQRQEAGRAMQAAMAQVLQDNEQAVREAAASTPTDRTHGTDGSDDRGDVPPEVEPDGSNGDGNSGQPTAGTARPTWPAHSPSRRPPRPRPRRCAQQRPVRSDERQP